MSKKGKFKQYTLDDGSITTALEVSEKIGCSVNNARTRLCVSSDPERVFKPKLDRKKNDLSAYALEKIMSRGMNDPMLALVLKTI